MLIKIGTLGKMKADFVNVRREDGYLVATMEVREGVKWEIVSALGYKEVWQVVKEVIKPSILWFVIGGWIGSKDAKPPKL